MSHPSAEFTRLILAVIWARRDYQETDNHQQVREAEQALSTFIIDHYDEVIEYDSDPTPTGKQRIPIHPTPGELVV